MSAVDNQGNESEKSDIATAMTEQGTPGEPGDLAAQLISPTQVNLQWTPASDDIGVAGYRVFRSSGGGAPVQVAYVTGLSFENPNLSPSTPYVFTVYAMDTHGQPSQGVSVSATTEAGIPTAPGNVVAQVVSSTELTLTWTASTDDVRVVGYRIFRGTAPGNLVLAGTSTSTTFRGTNLIPNTTYYFAVAALDNLMNQSPVSATAQATTDKGAPSKPTGLTAQPVNSVQINLSWAASTDDFTVAGYRVLRGSNCGSLAQIGFATTTSYNSAGLQPSTTYCHAVVAVDNMGFASEQSAPAQATTTAGTPTTPSGVTASAVSPTAVNLMWQPSTDDVGVAGYRVFRGIPPAEPVLVATATSTSLTSSGLTPSTTYCFHVVAVDQTGVVSANSATACARTLDPPDTSAPTQPAGLTGQAISTTQTALLWAASSDNVGVVGYRIYRGVAGGALAMVGSGPGTSYADSALSPGTTYYYSVTAVDVAGNVSAKSALAAVTTLPAPDSTAPIVTIADPLDGATVTGTITVLATATDAAGTGEQASGVATVRMQVDGNIVGAVLTARPYYIRLDTRTLTKGVHILTSAAADNAGNAAVSAPVTILVQ